MFTASDIRDRVQRMPFTPVELTTSSGEKYRITHPELVLVGKREVIIGIPAPDDPHYHDRILRVSILHITAIEDLPVGTGQPGSNGQVQS